MISRLPLVCALAPVFLTLVATNAVASEAYRTYTCVGVSERNEPEVITLSLESWDASVGGYTLMSVQRGTRSITILEQLDSERGTEFTLPDQTEILLTPVQKSRFSKFVWDSTSGKLSGYCAR